MKTVLFNKLADEVLAEMENAAKKLGICGVGAVACLEDSTVKSWTSRMRVVGKIRTDPTPDGTGYNFVAIAYSKLGEMMDTLKDSGSGTRPLINGEIGYPGGSIRRNGDGYIAAAFSGGTGEQDYGISIAALDMLESGK